MEEPREFWDPKGEPLMDCFSKIQRQCNQCSGSLGVPYYNRVSSLQADPTGKCNATYVWEEPLEEDSTHKGLTEFRTDERPLVKSSIFTAATRLTPARTESFFKTRGSSLSSSRSKNPQCWPHVQPMWLVITNSFLLIGIFQALLGPIFPPIWPMLGPGWAILSHVDPFSTFGLFWAKFRSWTAAQPQILDPPANKTIQYLIASLARAAISPSASQPAGRLAGWPETTAGRPIYISGQRQPASQPISQSANQPVSQRPASQPAGKPANRPRKGLNKEGGRERFKHKRKDSDVREKTQT